jgi:hypothetical protein
MPADFRMLSKAIFNTLSPTLSRGGEGVNGTAVKVMKILTKQEIQL